MKFKIFFITFLCFFVLNTKEAVAQSVGKTPEGFEYAKTGIGAGKAAELNDYVFFSLIIKGNDGKVFAEMEEGPKMPFLQINDQPLPSFDVQAVANLLKGSKIDETYSVKIPVDSFPMAAPEIAHLEYIEYRMAIKNIRNQEEYDIHMVEMQKEMEAKMEAAKLRAVEVETLVKTTLEDYKSGKLKVETTSSGLKYYILGNGQGDNAQSKDIVTVNYYGSLEDGTSFDDSFSRGQPFSLTLGQGMVIQGWEEGISYFNKGTKAFLFIPAELGYGEAGNPPVIPANSTLVFYVEIEDIKGN